MQEVELVLGQDLVLGQVQVRELAAGQVLAQALVPGQEQDLVQEAAQVLVFTQAGRHRVR